MKKEIYLDNSATTMIRPEVLNIMSENMKTYGNPSSIYKIARESKALIEDSREKVAKAIGALENEIYFTGGGSESNNWAFKGILNKYKGKHIITTSIEHHSVLHVCQFLEKEGYDVTYLPVDSLGHINLDELKNAIRSDTVMISIMFVNNEIGIINPIKEIGKIAREKNIIFHTDAVQAIGHIPIDVVDMNIDLLSMSAHKFYGPKGIGALYIKKGVRITPLIHGGAQERNRRAGTENIPAIIGMAAAISLAMSELESENKRLSKLRDKLIDGILKTIPFTMLNGSKDRRVCNNCNVSFKFIEGESVLLLLDMVGVCASSGSACTSGSLDPSHVLLALGLPHEEAHGSLRLSLGLYTTDSDIEFLLEKLPPIVQKMRNISPLYEEFLANKK